MKKSLKRCNKSTNKNYGKSKKRKPKKKNRSRSRSYQLRKMRGGNNSMLIDLSKGSAHLNILTSSYSSANKYEFDKLNQFTDKIKKNNYNGKQIVDLIYNPGTSLPQSIATPSRQYDHGSVTNGNPEKPITAGLNGTHVYVLVNPTNKSIEILGIVTNP